MDLVENQINEEFLDELPELDSDDLSSEEDSLESDEESLESDEKDTSVSTIFIKATFNSQFWAGWTGRRNLKDDFSF